MAGPFDLPSWLTPEPGWTGMDAFIKGSQAGAAIAANRLRAKQLYVDVQQHQQRMDLEERKFVTDNEASNLKNEVLRSKMANDAEDFETLRKWWPEFQKNTDGDITPPTLHDENTMVRISSAVLAKKDKIAQAQFAGLMSRPGFDLSDPENQKEYFDFVSRNPNTVAKWGNDGIMAPIKIAETNKRNRENTASLIKARDDRAYIAELEAERKRIVSDTKVAVDEAKLREMDERLALAKRGVIVKEGGLEVAKAKLALDQLLAQHEIPLTDAKVLKAQKDLALAERDMAVKEKNASLRERETTIKEQRINMDNWSAEDRIEFSRITQGILQTTTDPVGIAAAIHTARQDIERARKSKATAKASAGAAASAPSVPSVPNPEPETRNPKLTHPTNDFPPVPKNRDDLEEDEIYMTPRGPALWDGERFQPR